MKTKYTKHEIQIIPESDQDEVYLEGVLDLHNEGDTAIAERIAPVGLHSAWAYLSVYTGRVKK